jgi:N-acetylmuramoyl-L-alanine amidase
LFAGVFLNESTARPATLPGANPAKSGDLSLQIMDPRTESVSTTRSHANILGRTSPDAKINVHGEQARVFATGIFVRDQVPLKMGENQIRIVATAPNGRRVERTVTITRTAPAPATPRALGPGLEIDADSIEPARDVLLAQGDVLELSFRGTPGQMAEFRLVNSDWRPMTEVVGSEVGEPAGVYRAAMVAGAGPSGQDEPVKFRLRRQSSVSGASQSVAAGDAAVESQSKAKVGFWDETTLRLARVKEGGATLSFGMHEVRLGGPYLAELPAGTLLRLNGMRGDNYRVRLSSALEAWVAQRDVEWTQPGTPLPHVAFTSVSISGDDSADYVTIPYSARVPFAINPATSPAGRAAIEIDFYGAHHAATWISHAATAKLVREVTVAQVASDHLRVQVELHDRLLWGFQWSVSNNALRLTVRRPPTFASPPASPLKGLTIALEPGHGGGNSGARGVSGSLEKDINRMAVEDLARQFQAAGVRTVIVREGDEEISLSERTSRAIKSNADLFISVHANAAGQERGYLRVSGTSTYYKWSHNRDFSAAIHARLLAHTGLNDFGNVGNFNYYPTRVNTWMPSMLVEQAFMSNPEDEAKMLDPIFRREMMRAVVLGTEDWLKQVREARQP